MYSTRSWNAFKLHVSRKHRHDRQSDDVNYVVSSSSCGSDDDADANHYSIQQWFTASYLLKLETQYKMPQQAINDVVSCTGTYMKQSLDNFKLQLKKRLGEGQPIDNAIEDIELSSLDTFATIYMRDKFYETICGYVKPEPILLGRTVVRRNDRLQQMERLGYIVPFAKSLEQFLSMPEVWHFVCNPHPSNTDTMMDLCDGNYIKCSPLFSKHPQALQIILSHDDIEIVNPLGVHTKKHKVAMFYYTLGNIPPQYRSRLSAIQLLAIAKTVDLKKFGADPLLNDFITKLNLLQDKGIVINVSGEQDNVKGTLVMCPCDTLASQWLGGFKESSSFARKGCRTCDSGVRKMKTIFSNQNLETRSMTEHVERCQHLESLSRRARVYWSKLWGINKRSPLMLIDGIDLSNMLVHDPMHILLEGVVPYEMALLLHSLIVVDKAFLLTWLNEQIDNYPYSPADRAEKPEKIERKQFVVDVNIKQTSAAMLTLCQIFPLILGTKVDETNKKYLNFIRLLQITQLCTSPYASQDSAGQLQQLIMEHHEEFMMLYPHSSITPKMHFLVHMVNQVIQFGPLRHQWCLRFEAKHGLFKKFSWKCFKNLPKSMAEKHQRWMSYQILGESDTNVKSTCFLYAGDVTLEGDSVRVSDHYPNLEPEITQLCTSHGMSTQQPVTAYKSLKVIVHGHTYTAGLAVLLAIEDDLPVFAVIKEIFVIDHGKFFIVRKLRTLQFTVKKNAFTVRFNGEVGVILQTKLENPWPLTVHCEQDNMFIVNRYCHIAQFV